MNPDLIILDPQQTYLALSLTSLMTIAVYGYGRAIQRAVNHWTKLLVRGLEPRRFHDQYGDTAFQFVVSKSISPTKKLHCLEGTILFLAAGAYFVLSYHPWYYLIPFALVVFIAGEALARTVMPVPESNHFRMLIKQAIVRSAERGKKQMSDTASEMLAIIQRPSIKKVNFCLFFFEEGCFSRSEMVDEDAMRNASRQVAEQVRDAERGNLDLSECGWIPGRVHGNTSIAREQMHLFIAEQNLRTSLEYKVESREYDIEGIGICHVALAVQHS